MAQRLDTVTPDIKNPDAVDLDGAYLDEAPSVVGSPSLAGAANSQYYFFSNIMKKAKTAFNGVVDNSIISQYFRALQINIAGSEDAVDWDSITIFNTAGVLVRDSDGHVYSATGIGSNQNKNPSSPANIDFWFPCDTNDDLRKYAKRGTVLGAEMHTIHDRSGANYQQNLLNGKKTIDGIDYEQHLVHLDGTILTGNATLEAIFLNYPTSYLDYFAPEVVGTRTLIDMSSRHDTPMSVGGENDVLAEILENRGQGHNHTFDRSQSFNSDAGSTFSSYNSPVNSSGAVLGPITDGVNGTPRLGLTFRSNEFTVGASYIIVMPVA